MRLGYGPQEISVDSVEPLLVTGHKLCSEFARTEAYQALSELV